MRQLILVLGLGLLGAACGDDRPPPDAPIDAGPDEADAAEATCFENPRTHTELLNACVEWQFIDKDPVLPLLNPDGTLPELPQ